MANSSERTDKNALLAEVKAVEESGDERVIYTRARHAKIKSAFVGHRFAIHDGRKYRRVKITDEMVDKQFKKVLPSTQPTARQKYISIPPRKMRQVADLIIGKPVEEALGILTFTPKIAAHHMSKTLKSAVANLLSQEGTDNLSPEDLFVERVVVNPGPTAKRIRFQSMGRVFRYRKRFCHLEIYLGENAEVEEMAPVKKTEEKPKRRPAKKAAAKKTAAKKIAKKKTAAKKTTAKKTATKKAATKTTKKSASKDASEDK